MTFSKFTSAALAATALVSVSALPAHAQQTEAQQSGAEQSSEYQFRLTEEHVVSFVDAAVAIEDLMAEIRPELQSAATQDEQAAIREDAQTRMTDIVSDSGLTISEYNAIASAARENQSVAQRIQAEAQSRSAR